MKYQIQEKSGQWVDTHKDMYERFPLDKKRIVSKVTRKSIISGIERTMEIPMTEQQIQDYNAGTKHIQHIFPELTASQREFILNGITQEEWDEMYPPEEDEGPD